MKCFFALMLSLTMALALTACGNQQAQTAAEAASSIPDSGTEMERQETTGNTSAPEGEGGKVLVVCYSATGSTKAVAQIIANATGGDLFELTPVEPYTSDDLNWSDADSRVSREHDNENLRNVALAAASVGNWEAYDTVFIGYPIWWGIAAWPVNEFVRTNDFSGKTVIPFCTSSSSDLGESGEQLAAMAGSGDWQDGRRFHSSVPDSDVYAWVDELGLANARQAAE